MQFLLVISVLICNVYAYTTINSFRSLSNTAIQMASSISSEDCAKCPNAPKCNGEYLTQGCDGTGKIQGGIATISLFSWWPIKVFRPCPSYLAAGYQYRREGQTMDQVLFSEPSNKMREKMDLLRQLEEEKLKLEREEKQNVVLIDESTLSEEEKFLKNKFPEKE